MDRTKRFILNLWLTANIIPHILFHHSLLIAIIIARISGIHLFPLGKTDCPKHFSFSRNSTNFSKLSEVRDALLGRRISEPTEKTCSTAAELRIAVFLKVVIQACRCNERKEFALIFLLIFFQFSSAFAMERFKSSDWSSFGCLSYIYVTKSHKFS